MWILAQEVATPATVGGLAVTLLALVGLLVRHQLTQGEKRDDALTKAQADLVAQYELRARTAEQEVARLRRERRDDLANWAKERSALLAAIREGTPDEP